MIPSLILTIILGFLSPEGSTQEPATYKAPQVGSSIVVDGVLDDSAWMHAPWTSDFVDILGDSGPSPHFRTRAKLAWSRTHFLIGAEMEEPHLWGTLVDRDAIIYRDDDFEVFLDPSGSGTNYFEIEVNVLGTVLDLFMPRPYNLGGSADLSYDVEGLEVAVAHQGSANDPTDRDHGWTIELAIPWESLVPPPTTSEPTSFPFGSAPEIGDTWRVNFSRVDWPLEVVDGTYRKAADVTAENRHPESNWVWSPQGVVNMHVPGRWGAVRFEADPTGLPEGAP